MASALLDELVALLGHQPVIRLLRGFGGRRIKVPATMHQDQPLVFVIGWDAAVKLASAYGGADGIDLPAEMNLLIDLRNAAISEDFTRGRSITWLSHTYGVSRRQVNSVLDRLGHCEERAKRAVASRT